MALKIYTLDSGTRGTSVVQSHDGKEALCKAFNIPFFKTHSVEDIMVSIMKARNLGSGNVRQLTTLEFRDLSHLTPAGRKLPGVTVSYSV